MAKTKKSDDKLSSAFKDVLSNIAKELNLPVSVHLWDGSKVPMGTNDNEEFSIKIKESSVVASLIKKPTLENAALHYAAGNIAFDGADLITIGDSLKKNIDKKAVRRLDKIQILKQLWPFLFVKGKKALADHTYESDETGFDQKQRDETNFIQFHYDVSNDFYKLFLDPEMQYSCGYFTDWDNSLAQAQKDKLDHICKKLRLKEGDKLLDIGCGWGGLLCHAAQNYGVIGHGVTLSQEQYDFATAKVKKLGLQDKIKIEIKSYLDIEGEYDKISSIGMFEHIGLDNFDIYFNKVNTLLRERGIFLNHGTSRRAKANKKKSRNITKEKHMILKYIFPGSELAPIGHTVNSIEANGFEIHDVEGLREHYLHTSKYWCKNLSKNKEKAIKMVGEEYYNLWCAYLAGVYFGFANGSIPIFQVVATKIGKQKTFSSMPNTRSDLYQD